MATSSTVKVNGRVWKRVASFENSAANDRHYLLDLATGHVSFGNGAQGRIPPKGATIDVQYRFGSSSAGNTGEKLYGIYRGNVINNLDPLSRRRLQVHVPDAGVTLSWAAACTPVGVAALPGVGAGVWVSFEGGNTSHPVWLGISSDLTE